MRLRRFGSRFGSLTLVYGWALLALAGCGEEAPLEPDPGASPFYPGPSDAKAAAAQAEQNLGSGLNQSKTKVAINGPVAERTGASDSIDTRFGTNDVEKRLRIALRTAQKDPAAAAEQLDRLLAIEPIHREALFGRASLALEQSKTAKLPAERAAHDEKAVQLVRALTRAYDNPKPHEKELFARVLYRKTQILVEKGRVDEAVAAVKEAADLGFDAFGKVASDPSMASLQVTTQFQAAQKADDDLKLAKSRERVKKMLDTSPDIRFEFTLPDLSGKKVSLRDFKGKVVLLDFWGTWCGPCREAIPRLIELYKKRHASGLEIIGLSYERDASTESEAVEMVKKFVESNGVPYPCLLGDEATIKQVPGFRGFPTSVIVDRAGKVRLLITENTAQTVELITDAVRVLLAEPVPDGAATAKKSQ
jgi:thiol-disulfide isomerase/thioredoxin